MTIDDRDQIRVFLAAIFIFHFDSAHPHHRTRLLGSKITPASGGFYFVALLRILQFGNAFCSSATPASVTWVSFKPRNVSCCNFATSLRPASVILVLSKLS